MTRWTIDGHGDTGTRAWHSQATRRVNYNVSRLPSGFWLAEVDDDESSWHTVSASEITEAGAHARCEMHASGYRA